MDPKRAHECYHWHLIRNLNELPSAHWTTHLMFGVCACCGIWVWTASDLWSSHCLPLCGTNKAYLFLVPHCCSFLKHSHEISLHWELICIACTIRHDLASSFTMFAHFPNTHPTLNHYSNALRRILFQEVINICQVAVNQALFKPAPPDANSVTARPSRIS